MAKADGGAARPAPPAGLSGRGRFATARRAGSVHARRKRTAQASPVPAMAARRQHFSGSPSTDQLLSHFWQRCGSFM